MESNTIMLNEEQREELEKFTRSGIHSAMLIRRAKVILALDRSSKKDHLRIGRICESIGLSRQSLNEIRRDFLGSKSIEAFLTRKKRETPPVPAKITGEVEAHILALACSEPLPGCARWTLKLLAAKSVELHIESGVAGFTNIINTGLRPGVAQKGDYVDSLSPTSVARLLKKRNISLI
jgi:hypothetical protein